MIRRGIVGLIFVALTLSVMLLRAQDYEPPFGLITANNVIVRKGPDFAYPIIEQLPIDTSVVILGRAGGYFHRYDGRQWLQVDYDGRVGWILAGYMRTGRPFNAIPLIGVNLPRNRDGRVPPEFDLSSNICDRWQGAFSQGGNFMAGDQEMTFTFPELAGTVNYSLVAEAPSGLRRTFDTQETFITLTLGSLNYEAGIYTWRIIPYWNDTTNPRNAQQLCIAQQGGTFEKPDTTPPTPTPRP